MTHRQGWTRSIHFTFPVTDDGESGVLFVSGTGGEVETVVLLSKGETDSKKVRVEFSLKGIFPEICSRIESTASDF